VAASNQKPVTEVVYILDAPMPRPQARSEGTRCCNQCTVEADAYTIRCKRRPYAGLGPLTFTYVMELDDGGTRQHKDAVSPLPSLPLLLSLPMRRLAMRARTVTRCPGSRGRIPTPSCWARASFLRRVLCSGRKGKHPSRLKAQAGRFITHQSPRKQPNVVTAPRTRVVFLPPHWQT
jgi:hypothetical protein